jgi:hypothetical protein
MLAAVRRLPIVDAAALSTAAPLGSGAFTVAMPSSRPPGGPGDAPTLPRKLLVVTSDYFAVFGTRILEGRAFVDADAGAQPRAAIVDRGLARELWGDERVVGRCLPLAPGHPCVQLVGVSESRRIGSLRQPEGEIFHPLPRDGSSVPQAIVVRVRERPDVHVGAVAAAIRGSVTNPPFVRVTTLQALADVQARSWRLGAALFGLFGGLAAVLAAVGIYASLSFAIRQRTAEIGVRITLGASPGEIARMVLAQTSRLIALGWVAGMAAAMAFVRSVERLLYGVSPIDPATFVAASVIIVVAGLTGCLVPSMRAARVDPVQALKEG